MIEIAEFQKKLDQSSFVIDEQKKNEDRFLRNNPSWPSSRFFSMSNNAHLARNSSNRVSNNKLE